MRFESAIEATRRVVCSFGSVATTHLLHDALERAVNRHSRGVFTREAAFRRDLAITEVQLEPHQDRMAMLLAFLFESPLEGVELLLPDEIRKDGSLGRLGRVPRLVGEHGHLAAATAAARMLDDHVARDLAEERPEGSDAPILESARGMHRGERASLRILEHLVGVGVLMHARPHEALERPCIPEKQLVAGLAVARARAANQEQRLLQRI